MCTLPAAYEPLLLTLHKPQVVNGRTLIGDDYGTQLELISEVLYSIDPEGVIPRRFVNSSLAAFAECIEAHRNLYADRTTISSADEADEAAIVEAFAAALAEIDSKAIADPDNWWSLVVEDLRGC